MKSYVRHRIINAIDVKELVTLEYLDFEGKYADYSEKHDFCELCYVENGEIALTLEDSEIRLGASDMILIAPNTRHTYKSESGNSNKALVVCFVCQSHSLKHVFGAPITAGSDEKYIIGRIADEFCGTFFIDNELPVTRPDSNFGGQQAVILNLEYLIIRMLRQRLKDKKSELVLLDGENFYRDFTEIVAGYLKNNLSRRITLDEICSKFNYSRSFICRIFKEQTGEALMCYLNRLRCEEAGSLLCATSMTVGEISEAVGFSEAKYFGAAFKKQTGLSPTEYRLKMKAGDKP